MTRPDDVIARAFELAKSGTCGTVADIRRQLEIERYSQIAEHFDSRSLKKQLVALMQAIAPKD